MVIRWQHVLFDIFILKIDYNRYEILKSDPDRGYESIMQDIKAIADLFHDQRTAGLLSSHAANPRSGTAVRAFVKRIGKKRAEVEDKSYRERWCAWAR